MRLNTVRTGGPIGSLGHQPLIRRAVSLGVAMAIVLTGAVSSTAPGHAAVDEGRYLSQRTVSGIDSMPRLPDGVDIIDWKSRAQKLDEFLYDDAWQQTSGRKYATIVDDNTYGGWMMPSFYGDVRAASATTASQQESITILGSLLNSSIAGIDKDVPYPAGEAGETYLDSATKFFRPSGGVFTNFVGSSSGIATQQPYNDFWYVMLSNLNFYRLASLYPEWARREPKVQQYLTSIAERMTDMIDNLGGANFSLPTNVKGYNFDTDTIITSSNAGTQPDAAAGAAMILIYAWRHSGEAKYLQHAVWAMNYLDGLTSVNPYYEFAGLETLSAASILNAVAGTDYDITKFLSWVIGTRSSYRNWGGNSFRSSGVDLGGLTGDFTGHEYFFNSVYPMTTLVQMAKYDPSYAKAAGRWALNIANSARYFLPDQLDASHQSNPEYVGTSEAAAMAYEALNPSSITATGDAMSSWSNWGTGPDVTNLATYGMIYTGVLGGLVEKTNVDNLLRFNANKTDYFTADATDAEAAKYPTWLYYNPYTTVKDVQIDVGDTPQDLFDSTKGVYLAKNVTGVQGFKMLGDSATVIVLTPANSPAPVVDGNTTTIGGTLVNHSTATTLPLPGSDSVESIGITGPAAITAKDAATTYTATVTPSTAISADVTWTVAGIDGAATTKATISDAGVLTPLKNGQVLVRATATDGSGIYDELRVTLSGQSLAALSLNKPVTVSDTIDQAKERINDGDTGTRWNGKTGIGNDGHPWVYVDLANPANLSLITVEWEAAYARGFRLQWSNDLSGPWQDIQVFTNQSLSNHSTTRVSDASLESLRTAAPDGVRYVRLYTDTMYNSGWGISVYEFTIDGTYTVTEQVTGLEVSGANGATEITRRQRPLQMIATATPATATDKRVEWYTYDSAGNETTIADVDSTGKLLPRANGRVKVVARSVDGSNVSASTIIDISGQDNPNLAEGRTLTASQSELAAGNANDGDYGTRWSSGGMGSGTRASLEADLGTTKLVSSVTVAWEAAAAPSFDLQVRSSSAEDWVTVTSGAGIAGGFQDLEFNPLEARYVRLANMPKSSYGGISIWEFEVYGPPLLLRFNLNGLRSIFESLDSPDDQSVEYGQAVGDLPSLELAGYEFLGWNTAADGTGASYGSETVFSATSAVTLYAQYRPAVDRSGLEDVIGQVSGLSAGEFTSSSWAAARVESVLASARGVLARSDASQAEVDAAMTELSDAVTALVRRGDPGALTALVAAAEVLDGRLGGFTDESAASFRSAVTQARGALAAADDRSQTQLDAAAADLQAAIDGLQARTAAVDTSVLRAVVNAAAGLSNADSRFTAASWAALQARLVAARAVLGDGSATQEQVDAAVVGVNAAVVGLVPAPTSVVARVRLSQSQVRLVKGKSLRLSAGVYYTKVHPAYAGAVVWSSSNPKVAVVSADGAVSARRTGVVRLTATSVEANASGAKVSVSVPVTVVASKGKAKVTKVWASVPRSMSPGEVVYLAGKWVSAKATGIRVTFTSSNVGVAAVDVAGRVLADRKGTARITVKAGTRSKTYTVKVK